MRWRLKNDLRELRDLRRDLTIALERHAVEGSDIQGSVLAASELVTNAISYSEGEVDVILDWRGPKVVLTVVDVGPGFDLDAVRTPDDSEASGRGLLIASKIVSELTVCTNSPTGAVVTAVLPVRPACLPAIDAVPAVRGANGAPERLVSDELTRFRLRPGVTTVADRPSGLLHV